MPTAKTLAADKMTIRSLTPSFGYEALLEARDRSCGLHALVSIHSTARGPAAGGCRMFAYENVEHAIRDVERLSRGMTYKNAAVDLPLGGGKSVILGNPRKDKTPELMQAFGRFIATLDGKYFTAEDVGVTPSDMKEVAKETKYVAGLEDGPFASGDPSPVTARGVFLCIQEALRHNFGTADLHDRVFSVQGLGHVGLSICELLHNAGGRLIVSDLKTGVLDAAVSRFSAKVVPTDSILSQEADVFVPCAMGAILNKDTIGAIGSPLVVGAANNQLSEDDVGYQLHERGILYAPDYIVNGGGIVNVAMEILREYPRLCV